MVADAHGVFSATQKAPSPLQADGTADALADVLLKLADAQGLGQDDRPTSIAISTAGVVNDHGNAMEQCAPHLAPLLDPRWLNRLKHRFPNGPIILANDGDCALLGAAEAGYLQGAQSIGLMVVGTGLGFCVWKNGRRWRPGRRYTLLGALSLGGRNGDQVASASALANHAPDGNLIAVLNEPVYQELRDRYVQDFAHLVQSATTLYQLDEVAIAGGLVDAANLAGFDLAQHLENALPPEAPKISVLQDGNILQLRGAFALAKAEAVAEKARFQAAYTDLPTEKPDEPERRLEAMTATELVDTLLTAEQLAGESLLAEKASIADAAEAIAERLQQGGRLIYVGCGSSGRIAALDAVELPCTFGLPSSKAITLIAGGVSEAAMDVEHRFEEDASAVPELLLTSPKETDIVVGISASGSAYYVRSALAVARDRGALTILLSAATPETIFFDRHLPLCSGSEVLTGSTRMKAGTATKKILNALSTTAMILLGKARGTHMVDLACVNEKLRARARGILRELFGLDERGADQLLEAHDGQLLAAIQAKEIKDS